MATLCAWSVIVSGIFSSVKVLLRSKVVGIQTLMALMMWHFSNWTNDRTSKIKHNKSLGPSWLEMVRGCELVEGCWSETKEDEAYNIDASCSGCMGSMMGFPGCKLDSVFTDCIFKRC
jgi:hypothetical protein